MNQYPSEKLSRVVSLKISSKEYELLREVAKECCSKYRVTNEPTITAILRYLVRNCIKTRFPQSSQKQNTTDDTPISRRTSYTDIPGPPTGNTTSVRRRTSYADLVRQL